MSNKGRKPDKKELQLWAVVKKTINPLREQKEEMMDLLMEETSLTPAKKPKKQQPTPKTLKRAAPSQPVDGLQANHLDRKTLDRLQKGKIPIDGTIDLHGMRQEEAHTALNHFVLSAFQNRQRCVLVITGKGSRSDGDGVLKSRLPDWLSVAPLNEIVLRHDLAAPKHGGSGAFYLYLKRQRNVI